MKTRSWTKGLCGVAYGALLCASPASATTTRYVWADSPSPTPPYTNWATAARDIQTAVDAAQAWDMVLVTNGVYATGGRAVDGLMTNRVAVDKPVTLRSANGPTVTVIQGYQVPGTTNGDGAIRCVYLTDGSVLNGFTLTQGATRTAGSILEEGSGGGAWCQSTNALLTNCILTANAAAWFGGGVSKGTLKNCTLTGNWADSGGGASGDWADFSGGASGCSLTECTLTDNSADLGGGTYLCTLKNCVLKRNSAIWGGGGADGGTLNNCVLAGNSASRHGGGAVGGTLNNCTLTGNSAIGSSVIGQSASGGGAHGSTLNNCIVYYNTCDRGPANYSGGLLNFCCTTPSPTNGTGNTTTEPLLASPSHLSAGSPCRGAGSGSYAAGQDIDGEAWAHPPSIGCDEFWAGAVTGPLAVALQAAATNVSVAFAVAFVGEIEGRVSCSRWDFGDGTVVSNQPYAQHAWLSAGDYLVRLTAFNEEHLDGVSATVAVRVTETVHYVAVDSPNPVAPYTSWATAARTIQQAVDAANVPGALVLVSNGVYATGGKAVYGVTNRVAVDKPLRVESVNGPAVTVIQGCQRPESIHGMGAVRCVYLTNGAVLSGFTLTNGAIGSSGDPRLMNGGGLWCESTNAVVTNCTLTGNAAYRNGGGAYGGTLYNCTLTNNSALESGGGASDGLLNNCTLRGNSASSSGGGAYHGTLNNCLITGNSATGEYGSGGGASFSTLNNCIVYYNTAPYEANYYIGSGGTLNFCCTTPMPTNGTGNTTAEPQLASASHLSARSPCRGAGSRQYAAGLDLDSEPWADPPAIGCDEPWPGAVTGPLRVGLRAALTNVAVGFVVALRGDIEGHASNSRWKFGDGTVVSNQPYTQHAWTAAGDYTVRFTAFNEDHPAGVSTSVVVRVVEAVHYVSAASPNPLAPYSSWATAAQTIQQAVNAAKMPGALVLVSNGVYATGGKAVYGMTNRVAVTKPIRVESVNGPAVTVIQGHQVPGTTNERGAVRCVYLTNGAVLAGFTLTQGATQSSGDERTRNGGGLWCESTNALASNCTFTGNSAWLSGGGAAGGTLTHCTLRGNSASSGGGAFGATLNHCTLRNNSAGSGGGASYSTLNNCTLRGNSAKNGGGGLAGAH